MQISFETKKVCPKGCCLCVSSPCPAVDIGRVLRSSAEAACRPYPGVVLRTGAQSREMCPVDEVAAAWWKAAVELRDSLEMLVGEHGCWSTPSFLSAFSDYENPVCCFSQCLPNPGYQNPSRGPDRACLRILGPG